MSSDSPSVIGEEAARRSRLLASLEGFAGEEAGALTQADWEALAQLLEREQAVVSRLAEDKLGRGDPVTAEEARRVEQWRVRMEELLRRVAEARAQGEAELAELNATRRRLGRVRGSYVAAPSEERALPVWVG